MSSSVASRSVDALGWVVLGALGRVSGQLVVQITLARLLGPEAFGSFAVVLALMGLGLVLADAGFGAALVQRPNLTEEDIRQALGWTLLLSMTVATVIAMGAQAFAHLMGDPDLAPMCQVAAVLIVLMSLRNVSVSLLQRQLDFKGPQLIDFFSYVLCFGGVAIAAATQGWGAWSLLAGLAAQVLFSGVATYLRCRHSLRPRLTGDRALAAFGLRAMGNELTSWAAEQLDRFIIGRAWGLVALGQYTVSSSLARAPVGMLMASVRALTFAGTARAQEDRTAVAAALLLMIEAAVLITVPMFVIVSLEAEVVLVLVYGLAWREAAPLLAALAVAVPPLVVSTLVSSVLRGIGAVGLELRVLLATSALFLLCLAALSSGPLAVAVWCAPVALVLRTAWLTVVVSGRLDLPMSRVLGALRGAGVLAVWAAGCCLAVRTFAAGPVQTLPVLPLLAGLVSLALALVAANRLCMSTQLRELIGRECAGRLQRMRGARTAAIHSAARDAS